MTNTEAYVELKHEVKVTDERVGPWYKSFTGVHIYPLDPRPEDICIEDIAHALSNACRFTGMVKSFYSVGEHSVHVSHACEERDALWGLMHDASEAYLGDLNSPTKYGTHLGVEYRHLEWRWMHKICVRFHMNCMEPSSVTSADKRMGYIEAVQLYATPIDDARWETQRKMIRGDEPPIRCCTPRQAEAAFLKRFSCLTEGR